MDEKSLDELYAMTVVGTAALVWIYQREDSWLTPLSVSVGESGELSDIQDYLGEKILPFATNLHYSNDGFHCASMEATLLRQGLLPQSPTLLSYRMTTK